MDDKKLSGLLEQLHVEIDRTQTVDARGRQLLHDLSQEIDELLSRSSGGALRPRPTMAPGLEAAIGHFEVSHPDLTAALSELLTALSNAGI